MLKDNAYFALPPYPQVALNAAAALLLAIGLAACEPTTSNVAVNPTADLVRAPNIGPGARRVSASKAASYFTALCGAAKSGRNSLEATAAANGFAQNSDTGTYYSQTDDVSVKLSDSRCSIVFTSGNTALQIARAMVAATAELGPISVRDDGVLGGRHYYNAVAGLLG